MSMKKTDEHAGRILKGYEVEVCVKMFIKPDDDTFKAAEEMAKSLIVVKKPARAISMFVSWNERTGTNKETRHEATIGKFTTDDM